MQAPSYPYNNPYPHDASYPYRATSRSTWSTRQIIVGTLLGAFPWLVMSTFIVMGAVSNLFMNAAYSKVLTNAAIYGFLYTSPVVLLIAVVCLFLKGRRWTALALPVWCFTVFCAFVVAAVL